MYKYKLFGLNVVSEIDLHIDEYEISTTCVDVKISIAKYAFDNNVFCDSNESMIRIPNVAEYHVSNGNSIKIYKETNHIKSVLLYLLGSVFALLFLQRNTFALHGSAIKFRNKTYVILGESGAGKTTLAAYFCKLGGKILTDDVARVVSSKDGLIVYPSYSSIKVWDDSANELNIKVSEENRLLLREKKFSVSNSKHFTQAESKVDAVIVLEKTDIENVFLEKIDNQRSFCELIKHSYRSEFIFHKSDKIKYFKWITNLGSIPTYKLSRPMGKYTYEQQIEEILTKVDR